MEIKEFARECYGATFPLFAKSEVNGENTNEVYRVLRRTSRLYNPKTDLSRVIPWNFTKFLLSTEVVRNEYINPRAEAPEIEQLIKEMLNISE